LATGKVHFLSSFSASFFTDAQPFFSPPGAAQYRFHLLPFSGLSFARPLSSLYRQEALAFPLPERRFNS